MLKRFVNKHRMLISVLDFLDKNESKLTFAPAIDTNVDNLQAIMYNIGTMEEAQLSTTKGYTETKEAHKLVAIRGILEIIKRAKAYAIVIEDQILKNEVNFSYSRLSDMPQDSLITACNKVVGACKARLAEMADYGLTQKMLDDMGPALEAYAAALPGAKRVIANRKTATAELKKLFADADNTLRKLDALMAICSTSDPLFYQEYKNLRVIDDLKRKSQTNGDSDMGITGTVTNMETGLKQPGVLVSIEGSNATALTDAEGNYTLTLSEAGIYALKAELKGHDDYEEDEIEVTPGELTVVDFDMEPLA